jgi:hypothetical protein
MGKGARDTALLIGGTGEKPDARHRCAVDSFSITRVSRSTTL